MASNLFNTTFIEDDLGIIERAGMIREAPQSFFTITVSSFYRPLGYNLPSLVFLIVGFNTLFFHIFNLCLHLFTSAMVFLLARKLFDTATGLLASILYVSFPSFVIAVGFTSSLFQDELSKLFYILAFLLLYRKNPEPQRNKPYLVPSLMLLIGALCKDSWIGLFPAILMMDWVNYRKDSLKNRIKRCWVFLIPFLTIVLRFIMVDANAMQSSMTNYILWNFNLNNILYGISLPFIPFEIAEPNSTLNLIRFIIPIIFIGLPIYLIREQRNKIILLTVALIGVYIVQITASLNNFIFGWAHMFPLLVFSSMLISSTIRNLGNRFHEKMYFWLPASLVILLLIGASYPTSQMLTNVIKDISLGYSGWLRGAKVLVRSFPEDANIYSFSGLNYYVAKEVILGPKMHYNNIAVGKKVNRNIKGFITGKIEYIKAELKTVAYQPNFRAISYKYGKWEDLTDVIQDWVSKEEPFPESLVHEH